MSFALYVEIVERTAESEKEIRQIFILNRIIGCRSDNVGSFDYFGKAGVIIVTEFGSL